MTFRSKAMMVLAVAILASCAKPPVHPPPPPPPPTPKPCAKDTCISLYANNSGPAKVCETDTDPGNRGIVVDINRYRGLKEPVTFIYERIQTDENGTQIGSPVRDYRTLSPSLSLFSPFPDLVGR